MAAPTQPRVREYYNYDRETGQLIFKERPRAEFSVMRYAAHLGMVGTIAGTQIRDGYFRAYVDGKTYLVHKLVWLMEYGEWIEYPAYEIDHINGDRSDNRLANLRKVTKSENQRNAGQRVTNTSGVHGVNWKAGSNRWVARIWNGPRHVYLGQFETLHEAQIARRAAERVLGFTGTDRKYGIRGDSTQGRAGR